MVKKIKELCKNQGISIAKLEKQVGLGNGTIGKWEKFNRKPKYESLKSIAEVLGVPISELTGEDQKEKPPAQGGELDVTDIEYWDKALDGLPPELVQQIIVRATEKLVKPK